MYKSWLVTELVVIISSINPGGFIITILLFITCISKTNKNSCHSPVGTLVTLAEVDVPSMSTNKPYSKKYHEHNIHNTATFCIYSS